MVDHTTDEVQKKGATSREAMHNLGAQLKEMYNKLAEFQTMKGRCLFPRRYGAFEGRSSNVVSLAGSVYKPEASLSKILHSSRSEKSCWTKLVLYGKSADASLHQKNFDK